MKYETIILDFDGTIVDTRDSIVYTVKETLNKFGISSFNETKVQNLIGLPLKTTFKELARLNDKQVDNAIREYRLLYNRISFNKIHLFPNVKSTLIRLFKIGIKLAIASNRGKKVLTKLLNHLGITDLFLFIVGEQDVDNKKPAPDAVNLIIKKLKSTSEKTLVVGDTVFDIEMGNRAECDTCAVTYGYHGIEKLKSASPKYIIDNFSQLLNIILKKDKK